MTMTHMSRKDWFLLQPTRSEAPSLLLAQICRRAHPQHSGDELLVLSLGHLDVSVIIFTVCIYVFPTTVVSLVLGCGFYPFCLQAGDQLVHMFQDRFIPVVLSYVQLGFVGQHPPNKSTIFRMRTFRQVSKQSLASFANSSQVKPSPSNSLFGESRASSAMR